LRKTIVAAAAAILLLSGVGVAQAKSNDNSDDPNQHGLCTAYFNGQKNGHDKHGNPGPFQALADSAAAYTDSDGVDNDGDGQVDEDNESADMSEAENVYNYCDGLVGGNPDHGRYTCILDNDPDTEGNQTECENNEPPGNS
jgi:hypothetical protein